MKTYKFKIHFRNEQNNHKTVHYYMEALNMEGAIHKLSFRLKHQRITPDITKLVDILAEPECFVN